MTPILQLFFVLAVILLTSNLAGYISMRLKQPSVLGRLLIGLILGPTLINLVHLPVITDVHLGEMINHLAELGVMLLMFLAGIELELHELRKSSRVAALAGSFGVILPVLLGYLTGLATGMDQSHAMFLGLTLGATSVSISAQTLMELKVLRSKVGLGLLGAAVFDDILVILLLSTFIALSSGGAGVADVLLVLVKMIVFMGLSVAFGMWVLPRVSKLIHKLHISQGVVTFALVILLVYGLAAELLGGMAAITGAFIAGLMFARTGEKHDIEQNLHPLAYIFFVPIFFVNIGLVVNISDLGIGALSLILLISVVAVIGKIAGAGLGARLGQYTWLQSLQLGIGMVSRGEVGLIVAKVGLDQGLLTEDIFSAIVGMVIITTLLTPIMLRAAFRQPHTITTDSPDRTPA